MLNWIVWNRTVYLYKKYSVKPNQTKPNQTKPLNSNFIFRLMTFSRNSHVSKTRCWNTIVIWSVKNLKFMCPVGVSSDVCLAEITTGRRHGLFQAWDMTSTCSTFLATEIKRFCQSKLSLLSKKKSPSIRGSTSLQVCEDFASNQRPPGKLLLNFFHLFILIHASTFKLRYCFTRTSNHCSHTSNHCSLSSNHCFRTSNHCSRTSNRCSRTLNRCSRTSNHCSRTSNRCFCTSNHCSRTSNHCFPTSNHCSRTWNHCSRTWNRCSRTSNHCFPSSNYCSRTSNHCSHTSNHCSLSSNHCFRTSNHCSHTSNRYSRTSNHCSRTSNRCSRTSNHCFRTSNHCSRFYTYLAGYGICSSWIQIPNFNSHLLWFVSLTHTWYQQELRISLFLPLPNCVSSGVSGGSYGGCSGSRVCGGGYSNNFGCDVGGSGGVSSDGCYHIYQPLRSGRIWHKVNF